MIDASTDEQITGLGIAIHHGHAMGDYSVPLEMPAELAAVRSSNRATEAMKVYISILPKGFSHVEGIYLAYSLVDTIDGHVPYDTVKGDFSALCYALAVIRRRNAEWIAAYKLPTREDWLARESKIIA